MAKCPQCQRRQDALRKALFNLKVEEVLKQAGYGLVELAGLKEKEPLDDVDGDGPKEVGGADEGKDDGRPSNNRGRSVSRDGADDSKRGQPTD